jgi:hypothetical protein
VELQANLPSLAASGIVPFALSFDPVTVLRTFADAHGITYPLLSDAESWLIDRLGIRNTQVDPRDDHYGIPYPGSYFIGEDGRVVDKVFHDTHRTRDAARTTIREHFSLSVATTGPEDWAEAETLTAVAMLDSDSFVRGERIGLQMTIRTAPGIHIYGQPLPEGYIPTTLTVQVPETVRIEPVRYPPPHPLVTAWLDERLMVYAGEITLTTALVFAEQREDVTVTATLRYQACTTAECFIPQQLTFTLPMHYRTFPV